MTKDEAKLIQVGDKVFIRPDLETGKDYGGLTSWGGMLEPFKGTDGIAYVCGKHRGDLKLSRKKGDNPAGCYSYSPEMIAGFGFEWGEKMFFDCTSFANAIEDADETVFAGWAWHDGRIEYVDVDGEFWHFAAPARKPKTYTLELTEAEFQIISKKVEEMRK